jgi:hypothetical protein
VSNLLHKPGLSSNITIPGFLRHRLIRYRLEAPEFFVAYRFAKIYIIGHIFCMQNCTTVRVRRSTHKVLANLARESHSSIQAVLDQVLETHRRAVFVQRTNEAYAALRNDPAAWAEYQKELAAWDGTAGDGL